jgi:hypothetical protein
MSRTSINYEEVVGAYRVTTQFNLLAAQAAASRLFQIRNAHTSNLLVINRLTVRIAQTAAHTAAILAQLTARKLTAFTAVDTTNTTTLTGVPKKTGAMPAAPGSAAIRALTFAGHTAGMTGGTLTSGPGFGLVPVWLLAAVPTAGPSVVVERELIQADNQARPLTLLPDEGIGIENAVLLGAAAGSQVFVEMDWVEIAGV